MKILLKDAMVLTMNAANEAYEVGNVLVEDDKIVAVGHFDTDGQYDEVYDCKGKIVMPGLVNTHVHTSQQLARGMADDVDLLTWLRGRIWPYESNMTEEDSYVSTLAVAVEQIKSGCTSIIEAGGQHVSGMARGIAETGIRAKLAKSVMDTGDGLPSNWVHTADEEIASQLESMAKFRGAADGRIDVWFGLRTLFNCSDELVLKTKELADKYNTGITMHVAEGKSEVDYVTEKFGVPTVTHLRDLGVLDKNLLAVHTVWLTNEEVEMFRDYQVKVSHNPSSAMRVLGFAKVPRMLREGICVGIGTDGAPTNNHMDMIDELWVTSLIHKGWRLDPAVVKAQEILRMATINGANCMLDGDILGSLEVGKKADLIVINPDSIGMQPMHDPVANIVTSCHSTNVESTMCNGKWLMKNRVVLTVNEAEVIEMAKAHAKEIRERAGIVMPQRFKML